MPFGCIYICRYWEGADVCTMLEDIDFMCEVLRILMEACTDNGKNSLNLLIFCAQNYPVLQASMILLLGAQLGNN